ncbi:MAG TPA: KOW domain-containing RNA-binding protein [Limnochordia bacterium]|nr:KOW domain-containing RNA-binding protein [Limnochordia bacterium]HXK97143.1 KOW domain-containing RNA-binding protein [Limnochordia bacterium]
MGLEIGQLVSSKAGRDAGKKYIVIGVLDDKYVLVADGASRKVTQPKKKNIRHLVAHRQIAAEITQALQQKRKLTNEQLRLAIQSFTDTPEEQEEVSSGNGKG